MCASVAIVTQIPFGCAGIQKSNLSKAAGGKTTMELLAFAKPYLWTHAAGML